MTFIKDNYIIHTFKLRGVYIMGQNIVLKGKIDGLSNKQFTSEYNIYDTMSMELDNGQVTHLKRVIAVGGMTKDKVINH